MTITEKEVLDALARTAGTDRTWRTAPEIVEQILGKQAATPVAHRAAFALIDGMLKAGSLLRRRRPGTVLHEVMRAPPAVTRKAPPVPEPSPRHQHQRTDEEKRAILDAYARLEIGSKGAWLKPRHLDSSTLSAWRRELGAPTDEESTEPPAEVVSQLERREQVRARVLAASEPTLRTITGEELEKLGLQPSAPAAEPDPRGAGDTAQSPALARSGDEEPRPAAAAEANTRRHFSIDEKRELLAEYDALSKEYGARAAWLRPRGLRTQIITDWRNTLARKPTLADRAKAPPTEPIVTMTELVDRHAARAPAPLEAADIKPVDERVWASIRALEARLQRPEPQRIEQAEFKAAALDALAATLAAVESETLLPALLRAIAGDLRALQAA